MPSEAMLCAECGKFSKPQTLNLQAPTLLDRCNFAIAEWEAKHSEVVTNALAAIQRLPAVPPWLRIGVGVILLVLSLPMFVVWFRPYGGFAAGRTAIAYVVVGLACLLGRRILREPSGLQTQPAAHAPWVLFMGYASNVAVAQAIALLVIVGAALSGNVAQAWWAAIVAVALAGVLRRSTAQPASMIMGAIGLSVLLALWFVNDIGFTIAADAYAREFPKFIIPIAAPAWVIIGFAILPQLQMIKFGSVGIGSFKGDFSLKIFGSKVPVYLSTALVLLSTYSVISSIPYIPRYISVLGGS
ncbi:hypothetical protein [uncultured Sphingomonas sp.]|uniref:hypothetical protein n=1 Tax=uncultured Sphingomonas sp. TaxID=158754 RepID=UPI0037490196